MGDWLRSQSMSYVVLIVSADASKIIVRELGTLGCMEFVDLQSNLTAFQRPFTPLLKRFDDIENKIRFLAGELQNNGIAIVPRIVQKHFWIQDFRSTILHSVG